MLASLEQIVKIPSSLPKCCIFIVMFAWTKHHENQRAKHNICPPSVAEKTCETPRNCPPKPMWLLDSNHNPSLGPPQLHKPIWANDMFFPKPEGSCHFGRDFPKNPKSPCKNGPTGGNRWLCWICPEPINCYGILIQKMQLTWLYMTGDDMRQMFFLQLKCYPNVNVDALLTMDEINVHSCHTKENSHANHHHHYPSTP